MLHNSFKLEKNMCHGCSSATGSSKIDGQRYIFHEGNRPLNCHQYSITPEEFIFLTYKQIKTVPSHGSSHWLCRHSVQLPYFGTPLPANKHVLTQLCLSAPTEACEIRNTRRAARTPPRRRSSMESHSIEGKDKWREKDTLSVWSEALLRGFSHSGEWRGRGSTATEQQGLMFITDTEDRSALANYIHCCWYYWYFEGYHIRNQSVEYDGCLWQFVYVCVCFLNITGTEDRQSWRNVL